ncbi:MAG: hypothetical protein GTO46_06665 [Gemmatimonadetes bacterium]|nr:hypothetical protein [Gemmatimonadota bacterium]NIO31313.1 hypothetical protein [Gemmatimonadota bacterium]
MKKFILLLIAVAAIAFLEPRSRAHIMSAVPFLSDANNQRTATRALEQIAAYVQATATQSGRYPLTETFPNWLMQAELSAEDPWGSAYYLEVFPDSFVVGSPGPDSRRRTPDDIRVAEGRAVREEGLIPDYSPAPPPSSTKTRAMRAAEAASKGKGE